MRGVVIFSKIGLSSNYHQMRIHPRDIRNMIFITTNVHYEYLVMPFRLANAITSFMRLMNTILEPFSSKFVAMSLDDIMIYRKSKEEHERHLCMVLDVLRMEKLYAK